VPSKEQILSEIRRLAEENDGKALGRERFEGETGIRESDWSGRYWARWSDAIREAGLAPNEFQGRLENEAVLGPLALEVRRLGRLPTIAELKLRRREDPTFPSARVFERFGPKATLPARLLEYCQQDRDLEDVAAIVEPLVRDEEPAKQPDEAPAEDGSVYLVKSGRYYKIGRSNSRGRREYELRLQLPEPVEQIHFITTDDPAGIERYWHTRFADRRKNGEWFELAQADVRAFKQRKFM
jgi:hypothetical protein